MAKLITAQKSLKKVDAKGKEKLQDNYWHAQQKRSSWNLKKHLNLNTIRKKIGDGGNIEQVDTLLESIHYLVDPSDDDSDSEHSNTSSALFDDHSNWQCGMDQQGTDKQLKSLLPDPEPPPHLEQ